MGWFNLPKVFDILCYRILYFTVGHCLALLHRTSISSAKTDLLSIKINSLAVQTDQHRVFWHDVMCIPVLWRWVFVVFSQNELKEYVLWPKVN